MGKLIVIAIAAAVVMASQSMTRSEHAAAPVADKVLASSPFAMMVTASDLPATPFVAP